MQAVDAEDDDWCEDTSDAAVQARMEALSGAAKVMTISDDLEKSQQERIDMFYSFVKVCAPLMTFSDSESVSAPVAFCGV